MALQDRDHIQCVVKKAVIESKEDIDVLISASDSAAILGTDDMESGLQQADVLRENVRAKVVSKSWANGVIHQDDGLPRGQQLESSDSPEHTQGGIGIERRVWSIRRHQSRLQVSHPPATRNLRASSLLRPSGRGIGGHSRICSSN